MHSAAHTRQFVLPGGAYPLSRVSHLEEHLRWMFRCGRSEKTLLARRRTLVLLSEEIGTDPVHATFEDLERWQDWILATKGINQMRLSTALIRPYYAYIYARGYRNDDPAKLLPTPPPPNRLPRPMSEDNVALMLEGPVGGEADSRVRCWLLIAGWMGLRATELARMKRENFFLDEEGQHWLIIVGKGNRQRNVAVPEWLWNYLNPRMAEEGYCWRRLRGDGPVTGHHVSQYTNRYLHKIGIHDTLHSLRHRIATTVMEDSGGDIRLVQALLGHVDIKTTAVYTHVAPRRIARAVGRVAPPAGLDRHLRLVQDSHASVGGARSQG